jgi:lipoprotein-anchoring transpeptidase ErfK/SrfK
MSRILSGFLRGTAACALSTCVVLAQGPGGDLQQPRSGTQAARSATPTADDALGVQIRLDRAGFSAGEIDGRWGDNTTKAVEAYARARSLAPDNRAAVLSALEREAGDRSATTKYTITEADAAGPFAPDIPDDLQAQAKLPALAYRTIREALAERFHSSPALLETLNPTARFQAGETLTVPNVTPAPAVASTAEQPRDEAVEVTVSKGAGTLTVRRGKDVIFHAPTTTGSERDPLPLGEWTVTAVARDPTFRYNPELFWDSEPDETRATLPPGPNGPVGVIWIDLSRPHYGIHGTPEPSTIGYAQSHGCVRLTNWDAQRVAALVAPGTPVHFVR